MSFKFDHLLQRQFGNKFQLQIVFNNVMYLRKIYEILHQSRKIVLNKNKCIRVSNNIKT